MIKCESAELNTFRARKTTVSSIFLIILRFKWTSVWIVFLYISNFQWALLGDSGIAKTNVPQFLIPGRLWSVATQRNLWTPESERHLVAKNSSFKVYEIPAEQPGVARENKKKKCLKFFIIFSSLSPQTTHECPQKISAHSHRMGWQFGRPE